MRLMFTSLLVLAANCPIALFATIPLVTFEINGDKQSYRLVLDNPTSEVVVCSRVDIKAEIGDADCTRTVSTYRYSLKNLKLSPYSKYENVSFGIDFIAGLSKKSGKLSRAYCGQPEINFVCQ